MLRRSLRAPLLFGLFCLLALPLPSQEEPPRASLLLVGGIVVDGTGAPRRKADVRVTGDRIAAVGTLTALPGEKVIEAGGLVVAPGFIDTHSHADGGLLESPDAETQIRQGITTAVVGQDGGSALPLSAYFDALSKKKAALNIASFVGHGAVRRQVLGADFKRPATPAEMAKMQTVIEQEMRSGALGLSSGLEYDPGFYATTEELIACAKAAAKHGGLYISHIRNEDNKAFESFAELIRIAEAARLPAQISHIKLGAASVWGKAGDVATLLSDARKRGLDITADVYPYLYWQSGITVLIPTRDWSDRAAWEKGLKDIGGAGNVRLTTYTPDPAWQGKTLAEIAAMTKRDPVTVIQEIVAKTRGAGATGRESVVVTAMTEADLKQFLAAPHIMFCSDGALRGSHPRGAGSFPRILGRYVRDEKTLTLEAAIRKATALPAARLGFRDRGVIAPGRKADLVLFDPATVADKATIDQPTAPPVGIPYVIVNGVVVLENGKITGAHPGQALRRQ